MKSSEEMNFGTVQNLKWNVSGKDQRQGKGSRWNRAEQPWENRRRRVKRNGLTVSRV